jgi:hypothetical protein
MSIFDYEPVHITIPGCSDDPRAPALELPGVVIHREPELHPDDVTVVDGLRMTSVSRTLVDMAEVSTRDELLELFARARERGLLDMAAVDASYARVGWRPSLRVLRQVMDEFRD